jgi:hypothetical protein
MFDVSQRIFTLRKNFQVYGTEDRTRYTYQGDTFNVFSQRDNEKVFKYGFTNETVPGILSDQNSKETLGCPEIDFTESIAYVYKILFEENLSEEIIRGLNSSFAIQVKLLEKLGKPDTILELGPGCGLLAPLFIEHKKPIGITFVLVEAIPQLLVLQQQVLKIFSVLYKSFEYCSNFEAFKSLRKDPKKNIILHLSAWELYKIDFSIDVIVANNVLDQVTDNDFIEYFSELDRFVEKDTKLSIWGGIEKGGVSNLFLFGFGTYHKFGILNYLKEKYHLLDLRKVGSEFYALFQFNVSSSEPDFSDIITFERNLIKNALLQTTFLWIDDNANFLELHSELFIDSELVSSTSSASTDPHPCNIQRTHISNQKIKNGNHVLVFSYRWLGVVDFFQEMNWMVKVNKLSDRAVLMELKK